LYIKFHSVFERIAIFKGYKVNFIVSCDIDFEYINSGEKFRKEILDIYKLYFGENVYFMEQYEDKTINFKQLKSFTNISSKNNFIYEFKLVDIEVDEENNFNFKINYNYDSKFHLITIQERVNSYYLG
jgi:hypothetical protein